MIKLNVASAKCILFIYDTMCELVTYDHQNDQRPIFFSLPLRTQLFLKVGHGGAVKFTTRLRSISCGSYSDLRSRYVSLTKRWL